MKTKNKMKIKKQNIVLLKKYKNIKYNTVETI